MGMDSATTITSTYAQKRDHSYGMVSGSMGDQEVSAVMKDRQAGGVAR
jgi:hypothetical protein